MKTKISSPAIFLSIFLIIPALSAQIKSYTHPGQLYSIQIVDATDAPLYIKLTPIQLAQQDRHFFSAIESMPDFHDRLDYGRFFKNVRAYTADKKPLTVHRIGTNRWEISNARDLHHITYEVALHEAEGVIKNQALIGRRRQNYTVFRGAVVCGWIEGHETGYQRIDFQIPEGWQLVSDMNTIGEQAYAVDASQFLLDAIFVAGSNLAIKEFSAFTATHQAIFFAENNVDTINVENTLVKATQVAGLLYKFSPFKKYFIFAELLNSPSADYYDHNETAKSVSNSQHVLFHPETGSEQQIQEKILTGYLRSWLSSERYFKADTAKPYSQKYAHCAWLMEGLSLYFATRTLTQTGTWSHEKFLDTITEWINNVSKYNGSAALASRVYEISNGGTPNYAILVNRGALIGLLLDIQILYQSRGFKRLDDGLQALERAFLEKNEKLQVTYLAHLIHKATDIDVENFFHTYLEKPSPLPLQKAFAILGLQPEWNGEMLSGLSYLPKKETRAQAKQLRTWWLKKVDLK